MRDLVLFNVAIDSRLRGCDVVALRVDDLAPGGYSADRATVRQKKTGRPVKFELTETTRQAIDDYLRVTGKKSGEYLFTGRRLIGHMTTRQYARLLSRWLTNIGLDPHLLGRIPSPHQGYLDLSPNWQPASRTARSGAHQNREHRSISRHRGRRRPRDSRTS
ncbi:tyrosine-type recombinase/integrase [Bradyrhizobium sp. WYCCWR 13022]|nr:tyrosine-type recombinase/integrase [Bradyrhizobium sp. WYCCWR 13022]MDN4986801.1 tyrosine-type recombinase/integrase [Bradyrhizobium sp. WYCCWR 13022]